MDLLRLPDRRHRCRCTQWPVQNTIGLHHYKSCIDDIPNGKREFFYRPVLGKVMFLLMSAVLFTGRRGSLYDVTSRLAARSHVPSRGVSASGPMFLQGVSVSGPMLLPGVFLTENTLWTETTPPPHGKERVVCMLLECILVCFCFFLLFRRCD